MMNGTAPPPFAVRQRAWAGALDLVSASSCAPARIGPEAWHACRRIVTERDPITLTWGECGELLELHRRHFPARAA